MNKKFTLKPILTPLKAFYEPLSMDEQKQFDSLTPSELEHELQLLEVLSTLKKERKSPSRSSVDIVLNYSRKQPSKRDVVY